MNKKQTIIEIQKQLKNKKGYPEVGYLNKITENENLWLMMDIVMIKDEQRMLGLKAGLEVAKDIMKKEGYDFQFPDPETIKIEQDFAIREKDEVKE